MRSHDCSSEQEQRDCRSTCSVSEAGGSKVQVVHCSKCKVCPHQRDTLTAQMEGMWLRRQEGGKIQWCQHHYNDCPNAINWLHLGLAWAPLEIMEVCCPLVHPLSTCPGYLKQVALWAETMTPTPSTCHVMLSLGTGQTRSNCVWQRCWAMWWLFMERPASASFLISWVQYRLISSKELMYKQQLRIFKFPFVQFKIKRIHIFLLYFSTTGYQFSSLYYLIDIWSLEGK